MRRAQAEWDGITTSGEKKWKLQEQRKQEQKPSILKQFAAMKTEVSGSSVNHADKKLPGEEKSL